MPSKIFEKSIFSIKHGFNDTVLIAEVIPRKPVNAIAPALLDIEGYDCHMNFDPDTSNIDRSGTLGIVIYSLKSIMVNEIDFLVEGQYDHIWVEIPTEKDEGIV